jgi:hypothetical protein
MLKYLLDTNIVIYTIKIGARRKTSTNDETDLGKQRQGCLE